MNPSYDNSFGSFSSGGTNPNIPQQPNTASTQGDIIIGNNASTKKPNKGLVIGIIVAILAIIAIVAVFLFIQSAPDSKSTTLEKYYDLASYLENGGIDDESIDTSESNSEQAEDDGESATNLIYAISISDGSVSEIQTYYHELSKKQSEFYDSVNGKISDELLGEYKTTMKILNNAVDHATVRDDFIQTYLKDGQNAAEEYFSENISCELADGSTLAPICEAEIDYYDSSISEYISYKEFGCEVDESLEVICDDGLFENEDFINQILSTELPQRYLGVFQDEAAKNLLNSYIQELNARVLKEIQDA